MNSEKTDSAGLARVFEAQRHRLRAIAYRTLGSTWDADDAVQETWVRLSRADVDSIDNLEAWLTTVVSRASIDILRGRGAAHDELDDGMSSSGADNNGPELAVERTDAIDAALLVVLDELTPVERLSFVLHDIFGLAFDDIAPIVERSSAAARQLASRARRRVRSVDVPSQRARRSGAVAAFLKAAREGDFGQLLQLLDPEVELRADPAVVALSAPYADAGAPLLRPQVQGADAVARVFAGRADQAIVALIDGVPGAIYAPNGTTSAVYLIRFRGDRIWSVDVVGEPADLQQMEVRPMSG